MKKTLSIIALASFLVLPVIVLAQESSPETAPTVVTSGEELIDLVERIGNWIFALLLAVAAILLLYAGFKWIMAGGNPEEVNKARLMLVNALIGVAIALVAKGLVTVIRSILEG